MEITKQELKELEQAIALIRKTSLKPDGDHKVDKDNFRKFRYALGKNAQIIKAEAEGIDSEMESFNEEKKSVVLEYCSRDENDEPLVQNGQYHIADRKAFDEHLNKVEKEYGIPTLYAEIVDVDLHTVSEDCVPVDLPMYLYNPLFPILTEPEESGDV